MRILIRYLAVLLSIYIPNHGQVWGRDIKFEPAEDKWDIDLSGARIFNGYTHTVKFSVSIVILVTPLDAHATGNFQLDVSLSTSASPADSLSLPTTLTVDTEYVGELKAAHATGQPFTIKGSAQISNADDVDTCNSISHVCVKWTNAPSGPTITDTDTDNDYICKPYLTKCDPGWVDLKAVEFYLYNSVVESGGYTSVHLKTQATVENEEVIPTYKITMFLSKDTLIEPTEDKEITILPTSLDVVTSEQTYPGYRDLSGPGLKIPDVHTYLADNQYCGEAYIGVMLDGANSTDTFRYRGVVLEPDEWNNFMIYRITIMCPGDCFQASDFKYSMAYLQDGMYRSHSFPIWVNVTITTLNCERLAISLGAAQFKLSLYLHNSESLLTDGAISSSAIDLTGAGMHFPDNSLVLEARAPGERTYLVNVNMWINGSTIPDVSTLEVRDLHLVVTDATTSTGPSETILMNNYASAKATLRENSATADARFYGTPTTPSRLVINAPLATDAFAGDIIHDSVGINDDMSLYWSIDDRFDASDISSGIPMTVVPNGQYERTGSLNVTNVAPLDSAYVRFCGSIYAIMHIELESTYSETNWANNTHIGEIVLECDPTDKIGLTDLWITNPPVLWKGKPAMVTFTAIISCTATDCSTVGNFNIHVTLGAVVSTQVIVSGVLSGSDFNGNTRMTVTHTVVMTAPDTECSSSHSLHVSLTDPGSDWMDNNDLSSPLPEFRCSATGAVDIDATAVTVIGSSIELGTFTPFSFDVDMEVEDIWYPEVDWPRFQFELYLSLDSQLDTKKSYKIPYIPTDCNQDELSKGLINGTNSFTLKDAVGFYLPVIGLERFCGISGTKQVSLCVLLDTYDPIDNDNIKGQIDEIIETDFSNSKCTTTTIAFDQANQIDCPSITMATQQKLAVDIVGAIKLNGDPDMTAVLTNADMKFTFTVGVTNRHSQQLPETENTEGNFELSLILSKPDDTTQITLTPTPEQDVYRKLAINAGHTLTFELTVTVTAAEFASPVPFCERYEPSGVELRIDFDSITAPGFTADTPPEPRLFTLPCKPSLVPELSLHLPSNMAIYNAKTYKMPATVSLTAYSPGLPPDTGYDLSFFLISLDNKNLMGMAYVNETTRIVTQGGDGCKIDGTWTADGNPIVSGRTATLAGTVEFVIPASGCDCATLADSTKLSLVGVKATHTTFFPEYSFPRTILNGVTFPCTATNGVDLTVTAFAEITSPLKLHIPMDISITVDIADVTGTHAFDLEIWFSEDNQIQENTDHKVLTRNGDTGGDSFVESVPLWNSEAARFCQMNPIYVIIRAVSTVTNFVDLNLLDNLYSKAVQLSCPRDMYRVDSVSGLPTTLAAGVTNKFRLSVTVFNDAMEDLPVTDHRHNFHLELEDFPADGQPRTSWTEGLRVVSTRGLDVDIPNNTAATFTLEASRFISNEYCTTVDTSVSNLRVSLYQGLGLGETKYDAVLLNNHIQLPLSCTTDFIDLGIGNFDMTIPTQIDRLVIQAVTTETYNLKVYLSRDATLEEDQDKEIYSASHTGTATHNNLALDSGPDVPIYAPCQKVYYIAKVETAKIDPDYTNNVNALEFTIPCTDVVDLYSIDVTSQVQPTFTMDEKATIRFSAHVMNLNPTPISTGTADMMNFDFKLYTKMGVEYEREKMVNITPEWEFFGDEGDRRFQQVDASPGIATFRMVRANVTLTAAVCAMGVSHLFIGVESSSPHSECVLHNNYHAVPISCIEGSSQMDLYVMPDRNGGHRFRFPEKKTVVLGEGQKFVLEVGGDFAGPDGGATWARRSTAGDSPVFDVKFQLTTPDPNEPPITIPHKVKAQSTNRPITASTRFVLDGVLMFSLGQFAHLCNQDNLTLTVIVDPDDIHMETDEYNNEAVITGIRITGNEDDDKCDPNLSLTDWGISGLTLKPNTRHYAEFDGDQDLDLEVTIRCTARGVSCPSSVHLRLLLSELDECDGSPEPGKLAEYGYTWEKTGLSLVPVTASNYLHTEKIAIQQAIVAAMAEHDLSQFCGRLVCLRLVINPDGIQPDEADPIHPNVDWIQLRLHCPNIIGVGVVKMDVLPSTLGPSSSYVEVNMTVVNKGLPILSTSSPNMATYLKLRAADMSATTDAVSTTALEPITLSADWITGEYVVFEFTGASALTPSLSDLCIGVVGARHICIGIDLDGDSVAEDDEECFDLQTGPVSLDCARDGVLSDLKVELTDTVKFYQDADINFTFNVTLAFSGHSLPSLDGGQGLVTLEFYAQANMTCDPSTDQLVGDGDWAQLLSPITTLGDGDTVNLVGTSRVRVPNAACVPAGQHLCAHYVIRPEVFPAYRDSNTSTDCVCADISAVIVCEEAEDIEPAFFGLHEKSFKPGVCLSFDLFVRIEKAGGNVTFKGGFFLSTDEVYDATDTRIPYNYFIIDPARAVLERSYPEGNHTLNLNGLPLCIPEDIVTAPTECGPVYIIYTADIENEVAEKYENNNAFATNVTLICDGGLPGIPGIKNHIRLGNFSFKAPEQLSAGMNSDLLISYTAVNVGEDLPVPSTLTLSYRLVLTAVDGSIAGALLVDDIHWWQDLPPTFYKTMRSGQLHDFKDVKVTIPKMRLTKTLCKAMTAITLCLIREGDNVDDHCMSSLFPEDMKSCQLSYHRELRMIDFNAPSSFSTMDTLNFTLEYGMTLASNAIDIGPLDFRSGLFLTHDKETHPLTGHLLAEVFSNASASAGTSLWWRQEASEVSEAPSGDEYCGLQYLSVMVDSGQDIPEPQEDNNVITKPVTVLCPNDVWSMRTLTFETTEGELVENISLSFKMEIGVECVVDGCLIDTGTDNIMFTIRYDNGSEPIKDWFNITSTYNGTITPALGIGFRSGQIRTFSIRAEATLEPDACSNGIVYVTVYANSSTDVDEMVLNNNQKRIAYPCSPGLRENAELRDLLAYPAVLPGVTMGTIDGLASNLPILSQEDQIPFEISFKVTGAPITTSCGLPPASPFGFAFFLSDDRDLDAWDDPAEFSLPGGAVDVMCNLPQDESYVLTVPNIYGFTIPAGRCGHQNLIFYLDDTDRIEEVAESNNLAVTPVYIACEEDVWSLDESYVTLMGSLWPGRPTDLTVSIVFTNKGKFDVTSHDGPPVAISAYFSEDSALDTIQDTNVSTTIVRDLNDAEKQKLKLDLPAGKSLSLKFQLPNVSIDDASCVRSQYLIVNIEAVAGLQQVDADLSNNYRAAPLPVQCAGTADMSTTVLSTAEGFTGQVSWTNINVMPATVTYRLWVSHNPTLEKKLDWLLKEGSMTVIGPSGTDYTFMGISPALGNALQEAPDIFCGQVYLIGEVDVYDDLEEPDESNNRMSVDVVKGCNTDANRDIMTHQVQSHTKTNLASDGSFHMTLDLLVHCYSTDTTLCLPNEITDNTIYFYFTLKFLDEDLYHVADLAPNVINGDSGLVTMALLKESLNSGPKAIPIAGDFTLSDINVCKLIRYLEVTLEKGNDPSVADISLGPPESKIRIMPCTFSCDFSTVDLSVSSLGGSANYTESNLTLNLLVDVEAVDWPPNPDPDLPMFTYTIGLKSAAEPTREIPDIFYSPGAVVRSRAAADIVNGTLDLSEKTMNVRWDFLRFMCGRTDIKLTVDLDVADQLAETDETNNYMESPTPFAIEKCKPGIDFMITKFEMGRHSLSSGDLVPIDVDVRIVLTGTVGLLQREPPLTNYIITFALVDQIKSPTEVHIIPYSLFDLPELSQMIFPDDGGEKATIHDHTLDGMTIKDLRIPSEPSICGTVAPKSWFLRSTVTMTEQTLQTGAVITASYDKLPDNNHAYIHVNIKCIDDQLALYKATSVKLPDEVWPEAEYDIQFDLTITNLNNDIPDTPSGLFKVNLYFSDKSVWDQARLNANPTKLYLAGTDPGIEYRHVAGIKKDEKVTLPRLIGKMSIADCEAATAGRAEPTLFVQLVMEPPSVGYSVYLANDVLMIRLTSPIRCHAANVDLKIRRFEVNQRTEFVTVNANTPTFFSIIMEHTRTSAGGIPASRNNGLSYKFEFCLSSDDKLDGIDHCLDTVYTEEQLIYLEGGISKDTPSSIEFNGENLMMNTSNIELSFFCGRSFLFAKITDLKSAVNIDPNLDNNQKSLQITLRCPSDVISVDYADLSLLGNQHQFCAHVKTMFRFIANVTYLLDVDQPRVPGQRGYFRFFVSSRTNLDPTKDIELSASLNVDGLNDPFVVNESREFTGYVELDMGNIANARIEPNYILVLFMLAGRLAETEAIILNNYEAIPLSGLFNDTKDTDDLISSHFELLSGLEYTLGSSANYSFVMTALSTFSEDTTINRQLRFLRLLRITIFLSRDEEVDDSDEPIETFLYFYVTKNFTENILQIPGSLKPSLCGQVFLIVMVDSDNEIWECDESNNHLAQNLSIRCPYDLLELRAVNLVEAQNGAIFFASPSGITLSYQILPLKNLEPETKKRATSLTICARKKGNDVCHDVTPGETWHHGLTGETVTFTDPLVDSEMQTFYIKNHIDITAACDAEVEPLVDGDMEFVIKVLPGDSDYPMAGGVDGVLENNIGVQTFKCQCSGSKIDLSLLEFHLGTQLEDTTQLVLGPNPFVLKVKVEANPVTIYNDRINQPGPVFDFNFVLVTTLVRTLRFADDGTEVTATSVPFDTLTYDTSPHYGDINKRILPEDVFDLSDTSSGFSLPQSAFFKICLAESVSLGVNVDRYDDVLETDETNNVKSLVRLIKPNGTKCEGQDFDVKTFKLKYLSYNLLPAEQPVQYDLKVNTYLSGVQNASLSVINGLPNGTWKHFDVWIFLSHDKTFNMTSGDDVLLGLTLSFAQEQALKKSYSGYQEIALDGMLTVPINESTYPYCWKRISIGVFIRLGDEHRVKELTDMNNWGFFDCIFDCGNAVDECTRGLDNCHSNASCEDRDYSFTDPRREQVLDSLEDKDIPRFFCKCKQGFRGNGTYCENIDECTEMDQYEQPLHNCHVKDNKQCVDTEGSFSCECADGYQERRDLWIGSYCIDIDECEQQKDDCDPKATCLNMDGSFQCVCKPGFSGNGTHCENIDECQSDPCHGTATCMDYEDGFWCVCPPHHDGDLCEKVNGNWNEWSTWGDCSPKCGYGNSQRTRECNNPTPMNGGLNCEVKDDMRYKQMRTCHTDCEEEDSETDSDNGCSEGYHPVQRPDGTLCCDDIDECTPVNGEILHGCDPIGICTNKEGSYECSCRDGFYMDGRFCKDINECTSSNGNACDVNAECINTGGSYKCMCNSGYKEEKEGTGTCIEDRLLPFGAGAGDIEVTSESELHQGELVSPLIQVPKGLPLFGQLLVPCLYFTENGVIVATNDLLDTKRKDPRTKPRDLRTLTFSTEQKDRAIFAPWWADGESKRNVSSIWYQEYDQFEQEMNIRVKKIMEEMKTCDFSPTYMLKVTWEYMAPYYLSFDHELNTFQAVIATDNKHTCIIYLYDQKQMKWEPQERRVRPAAPPMVGYSVYSAGGATVNMSEVLGTSVFTIDSVQLRPNITNTTGIISYRLDSNDENYNNPQQKCLDWYFSEPDISEWGAELVGTCPHYLRQAKDDDRLVDEGSNSHRCFSRRFPLDNGANIRCCYDATSEAILDHNATCFSVASQMDFNDYGFIYRYSKDLTPADLHEVHDHLPFRWCCEEAHGGKRDFCKYYLEKRPLATSANYDYLIPGMVHGGVHYRTFDGKSETFNGFGEYVAFSSTFQKPDLVLQTRHDINTETNKTSICVSAVAMQVNSRSVVEMYITRADKILLTIVDGSVWTGGNPTSSGMYIEARGDRCRMVVYKEGIVLHVCSNSSCIRAVLELPASLLASPDDDRWKGLLGNADGNPGNDNPAGTNLESWSLQIVYGSSPLVSNANDMTLFSLYGPNYISASIPNALGYLDVDWTPTDLNMDEIGTSDQAMCRPLNAIESKFSCIFDAYVSGAKSFGLSTLHSELEFEEQSKLFSDIPPQFTNSSDYLVRLRVGEQFSIRLVATKANAKELSFTASFKQNGFEQLDTDQRQLQTMEGAVPGTAEARFRYTIDTVQVYFLSFVVKDENGASSKLNVKLELCDCKNGGKCEYGVGKDLGGCYSVASCSCPPGWTGQYCEQDLDGCAMMPCYRGCSDVKPENVQTDEGIREFTCASCPPDMDGDGENCYEFNECLLEEGHMRRHKCQQICKDLPESYYCMCEEGFLLQEDGKTCKDRLECDSVQLNTCDRINGGCLDNIPGTHTCVCREGFTKLKNNVCQDINECIEQDGNSKPLHKCQQICHNTVGDYECFCKKGFRTSTLDPTRCIDIDECTEDIDECGTYCENFIGGFLCTCDPGFDLQQDGVSCKPQHDKICPYRYDICTRDPKAICSWIDGKAECHCPRGYRPSFEDHPVCIDIDECRINLHNCHEEADCVNKNGSFSCVCKPGFAAAVGTTECNDVDECLVHPCPGPCINTIGSYYCPCPENYDRAEDGESCIDKNECEAGQQSPCDQFSTCRNLHGSYRCDCLPGFSKVNEADQCTNVIDCPSPNCQDRCDDTPGGYRCYCSNGYSIDPNDPNKCIDIDECMLPDTSTRCTHNCQNTIGSYHCLCRQGFILDNTDGKTCIPIDGCESQCGGGKCHIDVNGLHLCECNSGYRQTDNYQLAECKNIDECSQNHGCQQSYCKDKTPGYQCVPPPGYETTANGLSSIDVDECITGSHNCSILTSTCRNSNGSYHCICNTGFHMVDGTCTDVDECSQVRLQPVRCADYDIAECINTPGSYFCRCKSGYRGNGTYCTDWNECLDEVERCNRKTEVCVNDVGSFYCKCAQGYKLQWDSEAKNLTCQNINECRSPILNLCEPRERCVDKEGSYRCRCQQDEVAMNDGITCRAKTECTAEEKRRCGDFECTKRGCVCPYSKQGSLTSVTCEDIDECKANPCNLENSFCQNQDPDFTCVCKDALNAVRDEDGLGCIETNGNWGDWSERTKCTYTCAGTHSRHRVCNNPRPVGPNKTCPGASKNKDLCNNDISIQSCKAKNIYKCFFIDMNLPPERFEEIEEELKAALCYALNNLSSIQPYNETYKTYCRMDPSSPFDAQYLFEPGDLKMTGNYPRALHGNPSKCRVTMCATLDRFCSSNHHHISRRSVSEPGLRHHISRRSAYIGGLRQLLTNETYFLPLEYIQEAIGSNFLAYLNDELYDARVKELIGALNISVVQAFNEDQAVTTTTPLPSLPPATIPDWTIAVIVVASALLIIIVVVLLVLYCSKKKKAGSGRISPSDD